MFAMGLKFLYVFLIFRGMANSKLALMLTVSVFSSMASSIPSEQKFYLIIKSDLDEITEDLTML